MTTFRDDIDTSREPDPAIAPETTTSAEAKPSAERTRTTRAASALRPNKALGGSVKITTLVIAALVACLAGSSVFFGWQAHTQSDRLASMRADEADRGHAEKVALDYATGAADMDFKDLQAWQKRLTANTTPELSNKLKQAAGSMEQIITPLQWTSSATPIVAKVRSDTNGQFSVDCFVSVLTKNAQAPDGVQSTATYRLTIDKNAGWTITDVGGIDSALAKK
ncbi:hypothetical protein [Nocardia africana]|uniref:Mce-associated membrane protein n=1 Tax=Nocardia africana TaxID=134964 RepID=A0A378X173_9NOCA|nr:hypothetical protein [Nocardia africana]MCC3312268.1 hypothetical protein [Nocardia africana]SUA46424.1 Uncharacterised protein [Nocardia africana]